MSKISIFRRRRPGTLVLGFRPFRVRFNFLGFGYGQHLLFFRFKPCFFQLRLGFGPFVFMKIISFPVSFDLRRWKQCFFASFWTSIWAWPNPFWACRTLSELGRTLSGLGRTLCGLGRILSRRSRTHPESLSGLGRALSGRSRTLSELSPAQEI